MSYEGLLKGGLVGAVMGAVRKKAPPRQPPAASCIGLASHACSLPRTLACTCVYAHACVRPWTGVRHASAQAYQQVADQGGALRQRCQQQNPARSAAHDMPTCFEGRARCSSEGGALERAAMRSSPLHGTMRGLVDLEGVQRPDQSPTCSTETWSRATSRCRRWS